VPNTTKALVKSFCLISSFTSSIVRNAGWSG
jgi:hypothetical protein